MLLLTSVDRGRLAHQTSPHFVRSLLLRQQRMQIPRAPDSGGIA
jgi:hypothetical protein